MLLRKEARESAPWILLSVIVLLAIGGLLLRQEARYGQDNWRYSQLSPGQTVSPYMLTRESVLTGPGALLFTVSIGLGLILGIRHFWIPHFTRTWSFLLHRSVSRMSILASKLTAAAIGLVVFLGAVWIALYWYACREDLFAFPPSAKVFVNGWVFIALGLIAYLGTALSGLSRARWYTTKIFGLAFATLVLFVTITQSRVSSALLITLAGIVILLVQIIETFLKRQY